MDNTFSWKSFNDHISSIIAKDIGIVENKTKFVHSKESILYLYYTFVFPYLSYCNLIWGRTAKRYVNRLHLLQKSIIRLRHGTDHIPRPSHNETDDNSHKIFA